MGQERKTIVVHDGPFQADDVYAVALWFKYGDPAATGNPLFPGRFDITNVTDTDQLPYNVVRSRDPEVIAKADIVCDVGLEYSTTKLRFDHHQFKKPKDQDYVIPKGLHGDWHAKAKITPSSVGLVLDYLWHKNNIKNTGLLPIYLVNRMFKQLVLGLDGNDNGIKQISDIKHVCDCGKKTKIKVKQRYAPCTMSHSIKHYNHEEPKKEPQKQWVQFMKAVAEALIHLDHIDNGYWRDEELFDELKDIVDAQSGDHLMLGKFYPRHWNLLNRAKALHKFKRIIWTDYGGDGRLEYWVNVPPKDLGSNYYETYYKGLDASNVEDKDLRFVHENGHIGAAFTLDAAKKL